MTRFRVSVHIIPRRGLLDPQGKAVADALHTLGFAARRRGARRPPPRHRDRREGRRGRRGERAHHVRAAARESRHRGLRDRGSRQGMKVGIVRFPGSNCEDDAFHAVVDQLGERGRHALAQGSRPPGERRRDPPGGFSYGDYLRAGAIARFSPIMREVAAHAAKGGVVLGICNGFQIACEAGLLPGALLRNDAGYRSMPVTIRVEHTDTAFTAAAGRGPVPHDADRARRGTLRRERGRARSARGRGAGAVPVRRRRRARRRWTRTRTAPCATSPACATPRAT